MWSANDKIPNFMLKVCVNIEQLKKMERCIIIFIDSGNSGNPKK